MPRAGDARHRQSRARCCAEDQLGYRDPATINPADYADREDEGMLYVPKAGEMLYHLKDGPIGPAGA